MQLLRDHPALRDEILKYIVHIGEVFDWVELPVNLDSLKLMVDSLWNQSDEELGSDTSSTSIWKCDVCTYQNQHAQKCEMCGTPKPEHEDAANDLNLSQMHGDLIIVQRISPIGVHNASDSSPNGSVNTTAVNATSPLTIIAFPSLYPP